MAILTARQPEAPVVDTRGLVKDAFTMIQNELAARTDLAAQMSARQQQDFLNQAKVRMEISAAGAESYNRERQFRNDQLNQSIQLAQSQRQERELQMQERMLPLKLEGARLDNSQAAFNLRSAGPRLPLMLQGEALQNTAAAQRIDQDQTRFPLLTTGDALKNAGMAWEMDRDQARLPAMLESDSLKNAGMSLDIDTGILKRQGLENQLTLENETLPVQIGKAQEEMQRINLGKVAEGSLGNVGNVQEFSGWLDGSFVNLLGTPPEKLATVNRFLNASPWSDADKARARSQAENALNDIKIASGNTSLFPESGVTTVMQMLADNSTSMRDQRGRPVFMGDFPMSDVNNGRAGAGLPPLTPTEYAQLPRAPVKQSQIPGATGGSAASVAAVSSAWNRAQKLKIDVLQGQARALEERAKAAFVEDDKAAGNAFRSQADEIYKQAAAVSKEAQPVAAIAPVAIPQTPIQGAPPAAPQSAPAPQVTAPAPRVMAPAPSAPRAAAVSGDDLMDQAYALNKRAESLASQGKPDEAAALYEQASALINQSFSGSGPASAAPSSPQPVPGRNARMNAAFHVK